MLTVPATTFALSLEVRAAVIEDAVAHAHTYGLDTATERELDVLAGLCWAALDGVRAGEKDKALARELLDNIATVRVLRFVPELTEACAHCPAVFATEDELDIHHLLQHDEW